MDTETGETGEQKLVHAEGQAKGFYQQLPAPVLIGMEATGNSQWFMELVQDLGHVIWIGDAAQIRASYVRQQKTDNDEMIILSRIERAITLLHYLGVDWLPVDRVLVCGSVGASVSAQASGIVLGHINSKN